MDEVVGGVLKLERRGAGVLRDPANSFLARPDDPQVAADLVRRYGLVNGAVVEGPVRAAKEGLRLVDVKTVCGLPPDAFRKRTPFEQLTPITPYQRFDLGRGGDAGMRVVDLIAPIGKGTRGLIVAPPKSGKTRLLAQLALAMHADEPDLRIIMLLVDERPEEVTEFRRNVPAEVLASSNDQPLQEHIDLAELTLAHVRCELECGRNVVVLVDSLTRMTRAYNLRGSGAGRTLTGGIDAAAMEMPRRFFGLARKIEHGGSVTVIGTVLVGTGSALDQVVYEEFKATGNSELVLDRDLAEARIFPAVNLLASSTRREEQLYGEEEIERLARLRRWLAGGSPKAAMNGLLKLIQQTENNEELLRRIRV